MGLVYLPTFTHRNQPFMWVNIQSSHGCYGYTYISFNLVYFHPIFWGETGVNSWDLWTNTTGHRVTSCIADRRTRSLDGVKLMFEPRDAVTSVWQENDDELVMSCLVVATICKPKINIAGWKVMEHLFFLNGRYIFIHDCLFSWKMMVGRWQFSFEMVFLFVWGRKFRSLSGGGKRTLPWFHSWYPNRIHGTNGIFIYG